MDHIKYSYIKTTLASFIGKENAICLKPNFQSKHKKYKIRRLKI